MIFKDPHRRLRGTNVLFRAQHRHPQDNTPPSSTTQPSSKYHATLFIEPRHHIQSTNALFEVPTPYSSTTQPSKVPAWQWVKITPLINRAGMPCIFSKCDEYGGGSTMIPLRFIHTTKPVVVPLASKP